VSNHRTARSEAVKRTVASVADIATLAPSFERHLRAGNRSPRTIRTYAEAISQLDAFLLRAGMPRAVSSIKREHIESFVEDHLARYKASTALVRFKSLQQFFRWLEEEGEVTVSPMARMNPPKVQTTPPDVLKPEDVKALLKACAGNEFDERRDTAIITLFYDTGLRLSELVNLKLRSTEVEGSDIDLDRQVVFVLGKGNRARGVPIGAATVKAVDRYVRVRSTHPDAAVPEVWLGRHGRMQQSGVQQMLRRRAAQAGLAHLNPHAFRHTMAHQWLHSGGSETDLMQITGWQSRSMLQRYGASAAAERARDSHRRLSPADRL
jgi:site-specific recombinase XerD